MGCYGQRAANGHQECCSKNKHATNLVSTKSRPFQKFSLVSNFFITTTFFLFGICFKKFTFSTNFFAEPFCVFCLAKILFANNIFVYFKNYNSSKRIVTSGQ